MENSRQGLLDRYSFNRLLTCTCPQDFFNCRCMDCKPSIVFYHFTGYLDRICHHTCMHSMSLYLCFALSLSGFAISFIWHKWFAYIDSSSIHDHEISFKKAEYSETSCTECVYVPSNINWAIMIILYNISFWFFYCSILCHVHSLFFVPKC